MQSAIIKLPKELVSGTWKYNFRRTWILRGKSVWKWKWVWKQMLKMKVT